MNRTKRIKNILEKNFLEFDINVIDDSYNHRGHNNFDGNGETHIRIEFAKSQSKINRLDLHKKVNYLLKEEFKIGMHALQIKII